MSTSQTSSQAPASFVQRFAAELVDGLVVGAGGNAVGFVLGFVIAILMRGANEDTVEAIAGLVGGLIGLIGSWLYYALMESGPWGATLGKRLLGLQVTDNDGYAITFAQGSARFFAKILSGLVCGAGYLAMLFNPEKKTWHDQLSGTRVVDSRNSG